MDPLIEKELKKVERLRKALLKSFESLSETERQKYKTDFEKAFQSLDMLEKMLIERLC